MADLTGAPDVVGGDNRRQGGSARQMLAFLWTTDRQLRITSAMGGGVVGLGDEPDRVVGLGVEGCFGSDTGDSSPVAVHRRALAGESGSFQLDRQGRRFRARVAPLWDSEGQIAGCIGFAQQINERGKGPQELEQTRRELERQLEHVTAELARANRQLSKEREQRSKVEELLRTRTRELGERVKELKCLYDLSYLLDAPGITAGEVYQQTVDLIPRAWQYPEITCARIIAEGREYRTRNFSETTWKQASDIFAHGRRIGALEVYYLAERAESDEGPFLKEERSLLDEIADRLGKTAGERWAKEEIASLAKFPSENPNPVLRISRYGTVLYGNEASSILLDAWKCSEGRTLPARWQQILRGVLDTGQTQQTELECGDRVFSLTFAPVIDFEYVNVYALDITDRVRTEQERKRLIAELESKNAELERFTYTVSHDLKGPLITIQGFLGQLESDAASGRLDRMKDDAARIHNAAERMQRFLDELLELCRAGRAVSALEQVPLGELAGQAVDLLAGPISRGGVEVEISAELPVVLGDRRRLGAVLQNLVENAVKFMGDQPEPRIQIGARQEGDQSVCYVRDNGVGINPRYHQRVFELFDKLEQQSEGTGVGLALVKRIVEVHGGRIWVESEGKGTGCTFCFVVPGNGKGAGHDR